ncbi:MAG: hypothetical protein LBV46_00560, partial [Bacteroidales bacterium]|nr:hypothetical protein [Bacteroidales bacterium]
MLCIAMNIYGQNPCATIPVTLPFADGFEGEYGCWTMHDLDDNAYAQTPTFTRSNGSSSYYGP